MDFFADLTVKKRNKTYFTTKTQFSMWKTILFLSQSLNIFFISVLVSLMTNVKNPVKVVEVKLTVKGLFKWQSVYKAVERHTSPSWYWVCDSEGLSWPLKFSLWNSCVMADRDFPFVSGRNRPMKSAEDRQTAPKGTKQYSLNPLCKEKKDLFIFNRTVLHWTFDASFRWWALHSKPF